MTDTQGSAVNITPKPAARNRSFKRLILGLAFLFSVFTLYWTSGRTLILKGFNANVLQAQKSGHSVQHKGFFLSGFPLSFHGRVSSLSLSSRPGGSPWSIKGQSLYVQASSFRPLTWHSHHKGDARLDMRGPNGQRWLFDLRPFMFDMQSKLSMKGEVISHDITALRLRPRAVIGTDLPVNGLGRVKAGLRDIGADIDASLNLENIFLNPKTWPQLQKALGPHIEMISVQAKAVDLAGLKPEQIESWRTQEALIFGAWQVQWKALDIKGGFELNLFDKDSQNGHHGYVRLDLEDGTDLAENLSAQGVITQAQSRQFKLAMGLLPKNEAGVREIILPIRNRQIMFLGQVVYTF